MPPQLQAEPKTTAADQQVPLGRRMTVVASEARLKSRTLCTDLGTTSCAARSPLGSCRWRTARRRRCKRRCSARCWSRCQLPRVRRPWRWKTWPPLLVKAAGRHRRRHRRTRRRNRRASSRSCSPPRRRPSGTMPTRCSTISATASGRGCWTRRCSSPASLPSSGTRRRASCWCLACKRVAGRSFTPWPSLRYAASSRRWRKCRGTPTARSPWKRGMGSTRPRCPRS
mmetsp:Transcript_16446/g.62479  ORF Transcript_16446/g.62479 Transcript_16446/m.62479 type:complete len:227 (-) Transcript_16446:1613-2293(-)